MEPEYELACKHCHPEESASYRIHRGVWSGDDLSWLLTCLVEDFGRPRMELLVAKLVANLYEGNFEEGQYKNFPGHEDAVGRMTDAACDIVAGWAKHDEELRAKAFAIRGV